MMGRTPPPSASGVTTRSKKKEQEQTETETGTSNTTTSYETSSNTAEASGTGTEEGTIVASSRQGAVALVPTGQGHRSTTSSSVARRRAELEARLEFERREKERAEAAAAFARTQLELAQLSDLEEAAGPIREGVTGPERDWGNQDDGSCIFQGEHPRPTENPVRRSPNDITNLAEAIVSAIKGNTNNRPIAPPKYVNELYNFNGDPREWIAFRSTYYDTAQYFSNIENMGRLRRALQGQARDTVYSILYNERDPEVIIDALQRRFGKPTHLIKAEMAALEKLPLMTSDVRSIGTFASVVANSVSTIKMMNRIEYLHSPDIADRVIEKFNLHVKYRWHEFRSYHEQDPILISLSAFLNRLADQFETYDPIRTTRIVEGKLKKENVRNYQQTRKVHVAAEPPPTEFEYDEYNSSTTDGDYEDEVDPEFEREMNIVLAATASAAIKEQCIYCKAEHSIHKCANFLNLELREKWEAVKKSKVCFKCLKPNHRNFQCNAKPCGKDGCKMRHHYLLHRTPEPKKEEISTNKLVTINHLGTAKTFLKIIPVEISGPTGTCTVAALLDEGSMVTLLIEKFAHEIGAEGTVQPLTIEGVSGHQINNPESRHISLRIKGMFTRTYETVKAHTIKALNLSTQEVTVKDIENCPHLQEIRDQLIYDRVQPALLIGQDNWHLIVSRQIKSGPTNKPVASLTNLGWMLHGQHNTRPVIFVHDNPDTNSSEIDSLVKQHFELESLGIAPNRPKSDPEQRAVSILEKTTRLLPEGRYECGLLWKTDNETLPNNRASAVRRLVGIERKISKDPTFEVNYTQQVENLLTSGYAEQVTSTPTSPRTFYLPHFAVIHPQKGKMRLVFDAAARSTGKCLNDALLPGPDLLQSLFGVLIRFRQGPIAVAADIKEMFLRIQITEEDRDSLRFLWRKKEDTEPSEYRMTSLIFGASSSPCSAIFVKNKNASRFIDKHPAAVRAIESNFYMDDYLQSFDTPAEARQIATQVNHINKEGGFHLRGWASNHPDVIKDLQQEKETQISIGSHDQIEKTLGMLWNVANDAFKYTLNLRNTPEDVLKGVRPPTKREVTSAVMSVFDPLGLATPVLIQGKRLIQHLWRTGIDWDDYIPEELLGMWKQWLQNLHGLQDLKIPRCTNSLKEGELHTFMDASETAYSAAVYWRTTNGRQTTVTLIAAKARVTPLKTISIPRLELQAALLGSRLAANVQKETTANVSKRYFWSDSRTTLSWIKSDPRTFKSFVAHRLAEIEENTTTNEWRWVPTRHNVADDATRDIPRDFDINHRWFQGPSFLLQPPDEWPPDRSEPLSTPTGEEKSNIIAAVRHVELPIPDPTRFSSWRRLLRATARLLQSVDIFKSKLKPKPNNTVSAIKRTVNDKTWRKYSRKNSQKKLTSIPTPRDTNTNANPVMPLNDVHIANAEMLLVRTVQNDSFRDELFKLKHNENPPQNSKLKRLTLSLNNDIIYTETRVSDASKLPTLDGKHYIVRLLIRQYHEDYNHGNHMTIMNELRQKFHITSLRNVVKAIVRACSRCKLLRATPAKTPLGDLPLERLQKPKYAFTHTAVDYFGPLTITIGRRNEKRWVALYTCLTTRAIHLEIATSLSSDSMLLTLRRMIARRGTPKTLYSDNGTNFVGANRELQTELEKMSHKVNERGIRWKFIPVGAPHMGGAWERLVRSVKTALTATLNTRQPREEILHTLLLEAEHLINSRPLTNVYLNEDDEESLTPNHFLIGRSSGMQNFGDFDDTTLVGPANWKTVQVLADKFWQRWLREYLPTITPRYVTGERNFTNPRPGDIVLIVDGSLPRGTWPRGEIVHIYPGPDGKVRVVDVRTTAGTLRRPTTRLVRIIRRGQSSDEGTVLAPLSHGGETVED